ncbi:hypothetical protein BDN72DRAFT_832262 [Pluteus cervinus]|uniref:Uncharacterized protein n=1 Tax=Pluteus cervinus TaxID=181527 RepID=A0ACD3BC19_9AGAR|nr:hypothetical protein BDN72DRAFT_832262 [Pluteus cervinus]
MFPDIHAGFHDGDPGDDGTSTIHQLHFSDSEGSEDEGADDHPGDYSARMEELMGDDEADAQDVDEDDEGGFVYDGLDAVDLSDNYQNQLREVLGTEIDEDEHDAKEVEHSLVIETSPPDDDDDPLLNDSLSDRALSSGSLDPSYALTPPRFDSPGPNETQSRLARPFLHPNVSRLRSYTPQGSPLPSTGSYGTHSHIFDGTSPSPSHFDSMSRASSNSNMVGAGAIPRINGNSNLSPRDVFKWTDLRNITHHVFSSKAQQKASSILGVPSIGSPTVLAANGYICVGTDEGCTSIYDFKQTLKCVCGSGNARPVGPVTALALSHDHTYVASGHSTGHIQLFELKNPQHPVRHVPPTTLSIVRSGRKEGHLQGSRIVNIGFVAGRHTAIVSADEHGLAFYHSLGKMLFMEASDTLRILGKYPDDGPVSRPMNTSAPNFALGKRRRTRYCVLAMMPLPLGTSPHPTDGYNIIAMLTPTKLVVVGLKPSPRTWFKYAREPEEGAPWGQRSRGKGTLIWFPSVEEKGHATNGKNGKTQETGTHPILAFSWGTSIHLIRVSESKVRQSVQNPRTGKTSVIEVGRISFEEVSKWSVEENVLAMQWLSGNQVVVMTQNKLEVYQPPSSKPIESIPFNALDLMSPTLAATIDGSIPYADSVGEVAHSVRVYKGKIFLLTRDKVQVGALLTWADHILSLVQGGNFLQAIELTRLYYIGVAPGNRNALPDDLNLRKEMIGGKMRDLMLASTQYAFSEERMTDGTHNTPDGRGVDRTSLFEGLVSTCCRACVALDDFDFLFEDLFQHYDDHGILRIYLLQLEHFVLNSEIRHVPPRITQQLIALHENDGRSDHVERIIWHIDPGCLDINQTIQICQRHHLYDALIYIYTRALRDYVAPVVELLGTIRKLQQNRRARLESSGQGKGFDPVLEPLILDAYKIYPYLADVLSGLTYPGEDPLPPDEALQAKKDIYSFLFFGRSSVWPPGDDAKLVLTADEEGGVEPTYPYARLLLRFDSESFLHTLDIAFEDSFLNDETQGISRLLVIKILLEILSSGNLSSSDVTFVHIFVARNVPKYPQFLNMSPNTLHTILVGLAEDPDESTREDRQLAAEFLLSVYNPHESDRIIELFESAGFWRILRNWHKQERRWVSLLSTFINDPDLRSSEIFRNIDEVLSLTTHVHKGSPPIELLQTVSDALPYLIRLNLGSTANLIDRHFPQLHGRAVELIGDSASYKQYLYLRHLLGPPQVEEDEDTTPPHNRPPLALVDKSLLRLYVSLICQYDRNDLIANLQFIPPDQIDWNDVREESDGHEAYDAVVWALDQRDGPQEAISQAEDYEQRLSLRIANLFGKAVPMNAEEQEDVERDAFNLEALGRVGKDICLARSNSNWTGNVEDLWFRLLHSQVRCVQKLASHVEPGLDTTQKKVLDQLRNLVQDTFSALVSISSSTAVSFPRLFKRLVGSVPTATGTSYNEVRAILTGMLESYRSDGDMLVITKHLVDRDLFERMTELARDRSYGWTPSRGICSGCRKSLAFSDSSPTSPPEQIIVSRTGTIYHKSCLPSN